MTTPDEPGSPFSSGSPSSGVPPYGTPTDPARTTPPGARFFDGVRSWGVVRPDEGRWAAGVCAGLARRTGMSPGVVRLLFVLVGLLTGVGLALYGVLWLLLPHPDGRIHAQQLMSGTVTAGAVGGLLAIVADDPLGVGSWHDGPVGWHHGPGLLPLVLVGLAIWWFGTGRHRRGTPGAR